MTNLLYYNSTKILHNRKNLLSNMMGQKHLSSKQADIHLKVSVAFCKKIIPKTDKLKSKATRGFWRNRTHEGYHLLWWADPEKVQERYS